MGEGDRRGLLVEGLHLDLIGAAGLDPREVEAQLRLLVEGVPFVRLDRPCTVGDGIVTVAEGDEEALIARHDEAAARGRMTRFVPASGAASRMFRDWFRYLEAGRPEDPDGFTATLPLYPFFEELRRRVAAAGEDLDGLLANGRHEEVLRYILAPGGLNYGNLPKALIAFHRCGDNARTALEEHLAEAALTVRDAGGRCRVHFTVSPEHRKDVAAFLEAVKGRYEEEYGVKYLLGLSVQDPATNTVAADLGGRPVTTEDGRLLLRPGGHGSLLKNLNDLQGDIVFLKNIDNVAPDRLKDLRVRWQKVIGGLLVGLQERIFSCLMALSAPGVGEGELEGIENFCRRDLALDLPEDLRSRGREGRREFLFALLDRPLRVCGVVRNEGEPGGGPFWVRGEDGKVSRQIVEESQIDGGDPAQRAIWERATHFNPVDLVCAVRDFRGVPFDLRRFIDPKTASVTVKSERGRDIKVLEHPGLWNGSMARWLTVFVEVPLLTFNPVKTVADLLRPHHR